ncbi:MAG: type II toxin-antitoxin system RelE/ParE family toxin [Thermoleophilia bacterium]|nr:type II toxin-antitoxin system RelE/ParE family toxin [Thermoleophilia bacterium]
MRIFKTARFVRFARAEHISDGQLRQAVARAESGQYDGRLGGEVIKQRLARRGEGRSRGYRAVVLHRAGERAVFVFGYAKSRRDDLRPDEVAQFKRVARYVLSLTDDQLAVLVARGDLEEVVADDSGIPK